MRDDESKGKTSEGVVVKSSIWYTLGNVITKGINYITIPIFTKLLTTGEFGDYNNFISWVNLVMIISTLSLPASLLRARFDFRDDLYTYVKSILILETLTSVALFFVTALFSEFFVSLFSMPYKYIILIFAYVSVYSALEIYQNIQRYKYKYKTSIAISLSSALMTVVASLVLMACFEDKLEARLVGAYVPIIIVCVLLYSYYFVKGGRLNLSYWNYALKICIPYIPHMLAMTVLNSTDRVMITNLCGSVATAYYSLAYTCSLAVQVLWSSYNTAFGPWLGEKLNDNDYGSIYKTSGKYVLLFAIPVVGIMLVSPELIQILGGPSYSESLYVMPPVMVGCFFQFLYSMYVNIEQFEKKTVGMAVASCIAALLNFGLNTCLIPIFGYIVAAYTTLVGYICLFIIHFFLVKRMGFDKVYNTKIICIIAVVVGLVGIIVNYLYRIKMLRYTVLLIYLIIFTYMFFKNRKKIMTILKNK